VVKPLGDAEDDEVLHAGGWPRAFEIDECQSGWGP
jgi:hypothetical protein